jgi:hypothetical protein
MNEYEAAFHKTVLEAMERATERSRELKARAAEVSIRSQHLRAEAVRVQEQAFRKCLPRRST